MLDNLLFPSLWGGVVEFGKGGLTNSDGITEDYRQIILRNNVPFQEMFLCVKITVKVGARGYNHLHDYPSITLVQCISAA